MENSAVLPNYCHVTAHTLTGDISIYNLLGLEVVPGWPAMALVSYLMIGAEEEHI